MVYSATGTAYFDCIQLEEGESANAYNMLQNSDFEYSSAGWTASNGTSSDTLTTEKANTGSKSFKLTGEYNKDKNIYQTVNVSGNEADTYIISAFANAASVPFSKDDDINYFTITVKILYTDNTSVIKTPAYFNSAVINEWQNVSGVFTLSDDDPDTQKTPSQITVYLNYAKQVNTCCFDDICLIKEPVPTYTYDSEGNLVSAVETAQKTSALSYDEDNNLSSYTDEKLTQYTYTYAESGNPHRLISATDNTTGITYQYSYYDNGSFMAQDIKSSDGTESIRTSVVYRGTADGISYGAYVLRTSNQHGISTYYDYDLQSGRLLSVTDANGNETEYSYNDANGLLTEVSSGNSSVSYTYDSSYTKLTSVTHNGFSYNFVYDGFGNAVQTMVGDTPLVSNSYGSGNGPLNMSLYGNGDIKNYTYDIAGRLIGVQKGGSDAYEWTYSGSGIANTYTDNISGRKYIYTYDSLGRIIRVAGEDTASGDFYSSSDYVYDISNNLTQYTSTAGTLAVSAWYHYDAINRPTKSFFNTNCDHRYTYDSLGRFSGRDIKLTSTTVSSDYIYYNAENRSASGVTYKTTQLANETIGDRGYLYLYDDVGNIVQINEKTSANGDYIVKVKYTYDALGQLTREDNADLDKSIVYTYDNGGNITSVKEYAYTTGTLGTATKTVSYSYDNTWKDLLVSYDGDSITYDNIGNPLTYRDGMTFTWFGRELESATVGGTAITYKYDADGLRTYKKVGDTVHEYQYAGGRLVYENRGGIQFHYRYDVMGNLASITRIKADGTKFTLYAICNSKGDIEELRTISGTLYARYIYDTWGNTLHIYNASGAEITSTANLAVQNPIRYRGYYFDAETGLYYVSSRYYDPEVCRWINADGYVSTGQGVLGYNMFAFCGNNPVSRVDPTGQFWSEIWEFAKTAVTEIGKAMGLMSPAYAGCGGAAVADGPLPFGDIVAAAGAVLLTAGAVGLGLYQAAQAPAISIPKVKTKAEVIPVPQPPPTPTVIYRYYASKTKNLSPRPGRDYDGLSFSTEPPRPGVSAVVTTIEQVNATGILTAIPTGGTHVTVIPSNGTVNQWMSQGQTSIWSRTLSLIVVEWDGGY